MRSLIDKIDRMGDTVSRARLERVLQQIQEASLAMSTKVYEQLTQELRELAHTESAFVQKTLQEPIPTELKIKVGLPAVSTITAVVTKEPFHGQVLKDWVKQVGLNNALKAKQQLQIGLAEGESVSKLAKRLEFVSGQTRRNLEMVVRTSVNHVTNSVKAATYAANSDVVDRVMWRSVLDGRTSEICQARDGEEYDLDSDYPKPPAHPNCRSVIVPITKSFRDFGLDIDEVAPGTRASMNGQVPATETYGTWLKQQPDAFIQEVLGKQKAEFFTSGKLSLDKFVDSTGRTLTLDQLRGKYDL